MAFWIPLRAQSEERRNLQPKLTFIAAPFPAKQPPRRGFSGGNGGLIHLVSGRYGAEIGRILCHDPNRGGGSGGATLSAAAAANRVNFSAEEHRTEQSGDDVRAAHNCLTAAARRDDLAKARSLLRPPVRPSVRPPVSPQKNFQVRRLISSSPFSPLSLSLLRH